KITGFNNLVTTLSLKFSSERRAGYVSSFTFNKEVMQLLITSGIDQEITGSRIFTIHEAQARSLVFLHFELLW
ncbi:23502_t:CDS:1, partial [Dentiscutata erythropus]